MLVSLVAAISKNRVIGTGNGGIPWHLPRDSENFRSYTSGKWMLLGRRTFMEMEGWFVDQTPVVLTRTNDFGVSGGYAASSLEEAIDQARAGGAKELVVSGGADIYRLSLPFVEKLVITRVDADIEGSILFPEVDWDAWTMVESNRWEKDASNIYNMNLEIFVPSKC